MSNLLIDTDIFIDHLRGYRPATGFLRKVSGEYLGHISVLTEMDLLAGAMPKKEERDLIESLLKRFPSIPVSSVIARKAGQLLRTYRTKGLAPVDAIIASTALELKAILVTNNVKHFNHIEGLLTLQPYPKGNQK